MNLKTLGLATLLGMTLGTTADADHRQRDCRPRGGISIIMGQPPMYYPPEYYYGYDLRQHPRYRPYSPYGYERPRLVVPLGRDFRIELDMGRRNNRVYSPQYPPYYWDEW